MDDRDGTGSSLFYEPGHLSSSDHVGDRQDIGQEEAISVYMDNRSFGSE